MPATAPPSPHPSAPSTCHGRWMSPEFEPGLVSVIVPTYNRAHLIIETLDSVFAQTYRPIELLIIDDGSTDNTVDVVRQWEQVHQQDGFTIRFMSQENRGAPAARNLGLIESRGEFIQFLDSDDLIHPSKLQQQVCQLDTTGDDFTWANCGSFTETPVWPSAGPRQPRVRSVTDHITKGGSVNTVAGVYRRSICLSIGPWKEDLGVFQDREYNLRLFLTTNRISYSPGVFVLVRCAHGSRVSDGFHSPHLVHTMKTCEQVLNHFDALSANNSDALSAVYFSHALTMLAKSQINVARESLNQGLRLSRTRSRRFRLRGLQAVACLPHRMAASTVTGLMTCHNWRQQRVR